MTLNSNYRKILSDSLKHGHKHIIYLCSRHDKIPEDKFLNICTGRSVNYCIENAEGRKISRQIHDSFYDDTYKIFLDGEFRLAYANRNIGFFYEAEIKRLLLKVKEWMSLYRTNGDEEKLHEIVEQECENGDARLRKIDRKHPLQVRSDQESEEYEDHSSPESGSAENEEESEKEEIKELEGRSPSEDQASPKRLKPLRKKYRHFKMESDDGRSVEKICEDSDHESESEKSSSEDEEEYIEKEDDIPRKFPKNMRKQSRSKALKYQESSDYKFINDESEKESSEFINDESESEKESSGEEEEYIERGDDQRVRHSWKKFAKQIKPEKFHDKGGFLCEEKELISYKNQSETHQNESENQISEPASHNKGKTGELFKNKCRQKLMIDSDKEEDFQEVDFGMMETKRKRRLTKIQFLEEDEQDDFSIRENLNKKLKI